MVFILVLDKYMTGGTVTDEKTAKSKKTGVEISSGENGGSGAKEDGSKGLELVGEWG